MHAGRLAGRHMISHHEIARRQGALPYTRHRGPEDLCIGGPADCRHRMAPCKAHSLQRGMPHVTVQGEKRLHGEHVPPPLKTYGDAVMLTDHELQKMYDLAHCLHPDKRIALSVTLDACDRISRILKNSGSTGWPLRA